MLANARAVSAGEAQVHTQIDGQQWTLQAVPHMAKCVRSLREEYAALAGSDQALLPREHPLTAQPRARSHRMPALTGPIFL
jgi:hypothetical protein